MVTINPSISELSSSRSVGDFVGDFRARREGEDLAGLRTADTGSGGDEEAGPSATVASAASSLLMGSASSFGDGMVGED